MYRRIIISLCILCDIFIWSKAVAQQGDSHTFPSKYNVVWNSPSLNSSESMPVGGGDIGMNVWVENGDVLFYMSRSNTFDEHNCLLKQGRFRLRLSPNPFEDAVDFHQELNLEKGYVEISASGTTVQLWADIFHPVVHLEIENKEPIHAELYYENWRYKDRKIRDGEGHQNAYRWAIPAGLMTTADIIRAIDGQVTFFHRNPNKTVFDVTVAQQGLNGVKSQLMNPLKNLISGGRMWAENFVYEGTEDGRYVDTDYRAWKFKTVKAFRKQEIIIALHTSQATSDSVWEAGLQKTIASISSSKDKKSSQHWWREFWQRSYIIGEGEIADITRNYTLNRYMLGCNAYGEYPTKFNGGLFTFDPRFVKNNHPFTPDNREWGGGTMTAQNQRLVYWPMLKSGDFELMLPQFEFYNRILRNAELRSMVYWGHIGACFTEQIENFGLPNYAEYGIDAKTGKERPDYIDKGVEYNAWLEYMWDTALEFCQMILETKNYANSNIDRYIPLIESTLTFFDEHYRYLASHRGKRTLDEDGHLILYPGSACETYKMTKNAASTIAALQTVLETYGKKPEMRKTIPPIPFRVIKGKEMIAPAMTWERINNEETPQLYPVFPWRIYGVGRKGLEIARNTYLYDPQALKVRSHRGWKQDNIWAACLGLTDEARRLTLLKMSNGPHRFPAFFGHAFEWTPDMNWAGSGMIGMQEMLMQTVDDKIFLFPAWPKEWDVHFKLHAPKQTTIEIIYKNGEIKKLEVIPEYRKKDVKVLIQ